MEVSSNQQTLDEQLREGVSSAPGAVPPTGGAVPEDAQPRRGRPQHGVDELIDTLGLLLRAARDLDPARSHREISGLAGEADRVITALQEFEWHHRDLSRVRVAAVAETTRAELVGVIQRTLTIIRDSVLREDGEERS